MPRPNRRKAMANPNPTPKHPLYPVVMQSNPEAPSIPNPTSSSRNLYPSLDMKDLVDNLFPENSNINPTSHYEHWAQPSAPPSFQPSAPPSSQPSDRPSSQPSAPALATEEVLIKIPGAIVNLIDKHYSVELASGDFTIIRLVQGDDIVAVLARVGDEIQWPLAKEEASVKLDDSHYFFSLYAPPDSESESDSKSKTTTNDPDNFLNYGLTIASKGQGGLVKQLDEILKSYCSFSEQKVSDKAKKKGEALDDTMALETSPTELISDKKKELEERSAAYWTTLAPNVEDYNGRAAKLIAAGSGQLIKGILWCGDVTVERLKWGNEVMKKKMDPLSNKEVSPQTMRRIKRVKSVSKTTQKVAAGVLSGVLKVSGYFTSSVVCDAVEVAGKNVMSTSSTVTTELVSHRYGEQAGKAANDGLDAAGHAIGTAWTVFKIRKALNPKSAFKSSTLAKTAAKSAAEEARTKKSK
ncbi:Senescence/dehydration-associated protein-related protein [Prunus dulcis]|uniref:Senescence/dehydration-associated protein-related protein n=1 Tax=Prunus dulcis TaxID=3755 RepID=A0A4Y1RUJ6_PRUDU|nr:Senescence/dehydration-associated protein-related protein [Prunus dulcis]